MDLDLASEYLENHSPGNRYAYYPATKKWTGGDEGHCDLKSYGHQFLGGKGHLYIHLPFCHSLCTFCGCNIKISSNKEEHLEYVDALIQELRLKDPHGQALEKITTLTLGGGSPNALHPLALEKLIKELRTLGLKSTQLSDGLAEIDPVHFKTLYKEAFEELGITRYSMGVQDFDKEICKNVNRHQEHAHLEQTIDLLSCDQKIAYGMDLIYGLPKQGQAHIENWERSLKQFNPHWVSLYPMAPVPWLAPYQEAYGEFKEPDHQEKAHMFMKAHELLSQLGQHHFGFGHYINESGKLYAPLKERTLFRSVSGLYPHPYDFTLSLGVGAISESQQGLHQNNRILEKFKHTILKKGVVSTERNHLFSTKEKTFLIFARKVLASKVLPHEDLENMEILGLIGEIPSHWLQNTENQLSERGVLFLKNILQKAEKSYFGL